MQFRRRSPDTAPARSRALRPRRPLRALGATVAAALLACAQLAAPAHALAPTPAAPSTQGQQVGTLKCIVPGNLSSFVLHGTIPIAPRAFQRGSCPLKVIAPDGTPLNTQWEFVAQLQNWTIVELRALVATNRWSGLQTFTVLDGQTNDYSLTGFHPESLALVGLPGQVRLNLLDQAGAVHSLDLSGVYSTDELFRLGPNTITVRRNFQTAFGGLQAWFTINADRRQVELILNWHDGSLPARPDVYFLSVSLDLPPGWSYTPLLPDPVIGTKLLVKPDYHIIPQRMERSFRLVLHPDDEAPLIDGEGFAVGDWSRGGYMPQAIGLPNLDHTVVDLSVQKDVDYDLLSTDSPTCPGSQPESPLWPAQGVYYGGMTSGTDINQYEGVPTAVSGQADGLLSLYVEQLRYGSRQLGCIYGADGHPIEMDDYLNPDGTEPWVIFNSVFTGNPVKDSPFDFSQTGPGNGVASYDPLVFAPIDAQHLVRREKANKALIWLVNDPLARQYVQMDAEISRMTFYEGPGGMIQAPSPPYLGTPWGRAEAWAADTLTTAYAIGDAAYRLRTIHWFQDFVNDMALAQMPMGLFGALDTGKVPEDPPYGDGKNAFYWVHRTNEQIFMMLALRGIEETVGIPTSQLVATCGDAVWNFAWKDGTAGVLDRYPAGPIVGPRYTSKAEIPAGLTDTVCFDPYHVPGAIALGALEGASLADMQAMLFAYTGTSTLAGAKAVFEGYGLDQIWNRAPTLWILQNIVP